MRNFCIIFLTLFIITVTALGFSGIQAPNGMDDSGGEYLRIHIRANSNERDEQAVKYLVRDGLVEYLTPLVANFSTKAATMEGIRANLSEISKVATEILQKNGFSYAASAKLAIEQFPTRVYGEYILPAGEYSALIVELGSGKGDNWWCVVYPPLCFSGCANVIYKSKIQEIISRFYEK